MAEFRYMGRERVWADAAAVPATALPVAPTAPQVLAEIQRLYWSWFTTPKVERPFLEQKIFGLSQQFKALTGERRRRERRRAGPVR